ncbi:LOW QUALITY PROTEIN: SH3 domain-binding protein 5 homolog [Procambarus clarkii]|uniref:LOW QUALITY PROTEIN: SH3 domain-binding protein 5 homolog n=1 Tax=Procambarus clarkii TaxID=6728 RepID=UPI003742034E
MASVEEEALDPRVQIELEKLNTATDDINKLEAKLEEANNAFRATLTESTAILKNMAKKLGSCIEKARPYYEARELARTSQLDCQRAAVQYQRANALHHAARETIALAEERFVNCRHEHWQFDSAWQEMLNHATIKVMEAEAQKAASEREHMRRASVYQKAEQRVQQLQRGLRSSINKSLVYFEEKTKVHAQLESQKERVQQLQRAIAASKTSYAQSLRSLEQISEEIHEQRRCRLPREPGVGAELTPPEAVDAVLNNHGAKPFSPLEEMTAQEEKYWESLREKLEKLQVCSPQLVVTTNDAASSNGESADARERSVTGSSCASNCDLDQVAGMERVVSGESCHGSEGDEIHSPMEGKELSLDDVFLRVTIYAGNVPEKGKSLTKEEIQCLPDNCVDESTNSWNNVNKEPLLSRRTPVGGHAFEVDNLDVVDSNGHNIPVDDRTTISLVMNKDLAIGSVEKEIEVSKKCNEGESAALDVDVKDVKIEIDECDAENNYTHEDCNSDEEVSEIIKGIKEGYKGEGNVESESNEKLGEKEEGDGSSSPPPAMCQPSRVLSVIPELVESPHVPGDSLSQSV